MPRIVLSIYTLTHALSILICMSMYTHILLSIAMGKVLVKIPFYK